MYLKKKNNKLSCEFQLLREWKSLAVLQRDSWEPFTKTHARVKWQHWRCLSGNRKHRNIVTGNHVSWDSLFQRSVLWGAVIHCGALNCSAWVKIANFIVEQKESKVPIAFYTIETEVRALSLEMWDLDSVLSEKVQMHISSLLRIYSLNWSIRGLK